MQALRRRLQQPCHDGEALHDGPSALALESVAPFAHGNTDDRRLGDQQHQDQPQHQLARQAARQPDFLTPYLSAILACIGIRDLTLFRAEAAGRDPENVMARVRAEIRDHFQDERI